MTCSSWKRSTTWTTGDYEVEFVLDGVEYEYEVNAVTGKVTEVEVNRQDSSTDYGAGSDGVTDYGNTDYGAGSDGVTDYGNTDYGAGSDGVTDYGNSNYSTSNSTWNPGTTATTTPAAPTYSHHPPATAAAIPGMQLQLRKFRLWQLGI